MDAKARALSHTFSSPRITGVIMWKSDKNGALAGVLLLYHFCLSLIWSGGAPYFMIHDSQIR